MKSHEIDLAVKPMGVVALLVVLFLVMALGVGCRGRIAADAQAIAAVQEWIERELNPEASSGTLAAMGLEGVEVFGPILFGKCKLDGSWTDHERQVTAEVWARGLDPHHGYVQRKYSISGTLLVRGGAGKIESSRIAATEPLSGGRQFGMTIMYIITRLLYAIMVIGNPFIVLGVYSFLTSCSGPYLNLEGLGRAIVGLWCFYCVCASGWIFITSVYRMYHHWYAVPVWLMGLLVIYGALKFLHARIAK